MNYGLNNFIYLFVAVAPAFSCISTPFMWLGTEADFTFWGQDKNIGCEVFLYVDDEKYISVENSYWPHWWHSVWCSIRNTGLMVKNLSSFFPSAAELQHGLECVTSSLLFLLACIFVKAWTAPCTVGHWLQLSFPNTTISHKANLWIISVGCLIENKFILTLVVECRYYCKEMEFSAAVQS